MMPASSVRSNQTKSETKVSHEITTTSRENHHFKEVLERRGSRAAFGASLWTRLVRIIGAFLS
jgi:hypothetical protein